MDQKYLQDALKDAAYGIDKCNTLLTFMRKRQALEEEYSRDLSNIVSDI